MNPRLSAPSHADLVLLEADGALPSLAVLRSEPLKFPALLFALPIMPPDVLEVLLEPQLDPLIGRDHEVERVVQIPALASVRSAGMLFVSAPIVVEQPMKVQEIALPPSLLPTVHSTRQ